MEMCTLLARAKIRYISANPSQKAWYSIYQTEEPKTILHIMNERLAIRCHDATSSGRSTKGKVKIQHMPLKFYLPLCKLCFSAELV